MGKVEGPRKLEGLKKLEGRKEMEGPKNVEGQIILPAPSPCLHQPSGDYREFRRGLVKLPQQTETLVFNLKSECKNLPNKSKDRRLKKKMTQ